MDAVHIPMGNNTPKPPNGSALAAGLHGKGSPQHAAAVAAARARSSLFALQAQSGRYAASSDSDAAYDDDDNGGHGHRRRRRRRFRWWIQRDSLVRRLSLSVGKEGSRRRRRHDNDTFADHALVQSWPGGAARVREALGPELPRPPSVFTLAKGHIGSTVEPPAVGAAAGSTATALLAHQQPVRFGAAALTRADRALKREAARGSGVLAGLGDQDLARVSRLERDVLRFFFAAGADGVGVAVSEEDDDDDCDADCESDSESGRERVRVASGKGVTVTSAPRGLHISASLASVASSVLTGLSFGSLSSRGGAPVTATDDKPAAAPAATTAADSNDDDNIDGRWVRVEDAPTWTLDVAVPDARTRLLLHVMCRYYGLVSRSHDSDEHGCRVTRVAMPRALREALLVSAAAAAAVDDAEDLSCDDDDDDDADAESDADAKAAARWRASCTDGAARLLRRSEAARQRRCALRRRQRRRLRAAAAVATGDEVFEMDDIAVALSSPPTRLSSSTPSENDQDEDDGFGVGVGDNGRRRRRRAGDVPAFLEMPAIPFVEYFFGAEALA